MYKKAVSLFLFFIFSILVIPTSFAYDRQLEQDITNLEGGTVVVPMQVECRDENGVIKINVTCTGNYGSAAINYTGIGSKSVHWRVNPKFSLGYYFNGEVRIKTSSGVLVESYGIQGVGAVGSSVSGQVYLGGLSSGVYIAELTGVAIDTNGQLSWVVPNCEVSVVIP
ncbi:hypothetical protein [Paenibacillus sp. MSJ-34]|uniref:hypothetical protein n=1 Tax=Paenibacillus sp. MSJ-34 TaxID=2841529 RepID=UPI001C119FFD|nr:hypothetical protein [Paenibacillus sp. MSJ-34]MBU5440717.1 hypothetical protein [Paenibacillus sp. MSJ-34]